MPAKKNPVEKPLVRRSKRKRGRELSRSPLNSLRDRGSEHATHERSLRKRGAPVGNRNAVTHGLYSRDLAALGPEAVSRRVVNNLKGEIVILKDLVFRLYQQGMSLKDPLETAVIVRGVALASIAMCRLLDKHDQYKPPSPAYLAWKRKSEPAFSAEDYPFPSEEGDDLPDLTPFEEDALARAGDILDRLGNAADQAIQAVEEPATPAEPEKPMFEKIDLLNDPQYKKWPYVGDPPDYPGGDVSGIVPREENSLNSDYFRDDDENEN